MHYFKRHWDEHRGDEYADWGSATYYFETDDMLQPIRQIEIYVNGQVLRYDTKHQEDEYGGLSIISLDEVDFAPYEITDKEFNDVWNSPNVTLPRD